MAAAKRRLKNIFTAGLQTGANGVNFTEFLAGSASFTSPSFTGGTAGSVEEVNITISNLTAAHYLLLQAGSALSPCTALIRANAGTGSAAATIAYTAGSGGAAAAEATVVVDYLAFTL